jgi:hypothetical protein
MGRRASGRGMGSRYRTADMQAIGQATDDVAPHVLVRDALHQYHRDLALEHQQCGSDTQHHQYRSENPFFERFHAV